MSLSVLGIHPRTGWSWSVRVDTGTLRSIGIVGVLWMTEAPCPHQHRRFARAAACARRMAGRMAPL